MCGSGSPTDPNSHPGPPPRPPTPNVINHASTGHDDGCRPDEGVIIKL